MPVVVVPCHVKLGAAALPLPTTTVPPAYTLRGLVAPEAPMS